LRAGQVQRVDIARARDDAGGEGFDVGGGQVLHVLERQILALRVDDLETLGGKIARERRIVPLRIWRGDGDAANVHVT
jgi:hypothetical protein